MSRILAAAALVVAGGGRLALPPAFGVRGQRVEEQDPGDQAVQNRGQQQRQHEEDAEVEEVNGQVELPGDPVAARDDGDVGEHLQLDVGQIEPHDAVDGGADPNQQDDPPGPGQRAQELGLDRVADGDVALDGEGGDGARGRVDAQVLQVGDEQAAAAAEHPGGEQAVRDGGQPGGRQDHQVGHRQTHQVAVGWSAHVPGDEHHQDHHHVPHDAQRADEEQQQAAHNFVLDAVVRPGPVLVLVQVRRGRG